MHISELPHDILLDINYYLDFPSLLNSRLICRSFNALSSPTVLKNIRIILGKESELESDEEIAERLDLCVKYFPVQYVQHLSVTTRGRATFSVKEDIAWSLCKKIEGSAALHSLTLVWSHPWGNEDPATYFTIEDWQDRIIKSVLSSTGGFIRNLSIQAPMNIDGLPPSLLDVQGLKSLKLRINQWKCTGGQHFRRAAGHLSTAGKDVCCIHPSVAHIVGRMIQQNTTLEQLEVLQGCMSRPWAALDTIGDSLLHLQHLHLSGFSFPATTSPLFNSFRCLQSLSVRPKYSDMVVDNLWASLKAENIRLTKLLTAQVSVAFAEYLASFSGLEELDIRCINKIPDDISLQLTPAFFDRALPSHSQSLRKLAVHFDNGAYRVPGWYYDPSIWLPALSQMTVLRSLHVYPQYQEQFALDDDPIHQSYQNIIHDLSGLRSLETLELRWCDESYGEDIDLEAQTWNSDDYFAPAMRKVGSKLVTETGRPRVLELKGVTLVATLKDTDSQWQYLEKTIDV
ncbi:hypothetical protein AX16_002910 [Volvariella volvacea WC 439]|nr:hypothetical protein AX16_002910 [Volvariella volvacea WC 439]